MIETEGAFDRDWSLADLASPKLLDSIAALLPALLGEGASLVDPAGKVVIGSGEVAHLRTPIRVDLEPIAYLHARENESGLQASARLMELLLRSEMRYRMATSLHNEVVQGDYEELQRRNAELQGSESRYKALAEHLEERVREQVQVIERSQRQLYQNEKLASVGQLAAGVAHEVNTPLGFVRSNLNTSENYRRQFELFFREAAQAKSPKAEEISYLLLDLKELIEESISGVDRIAHIVSALKDFSRVDKAELGQADLNQVIRDVCVVAASRVEPQAEVVLDLARLSPVRCHVANMGQVILNLLINAAQAMERRGKIIVASREKGNEVHITVADNGRGMAPDQLERIFEPFFTTKEVGVGTGLGLTVSRDIVTAHGGRIEVKSKPGVGTIFTVILPRA